ncbi:MAG TPA: TRAP transporter small permease [Desulfomicrobiaceae bacterium]|nr:TRAP transporter small permease [Desulfomicrobiaceae bacterium]
MIFLDRISRALNKGLLALGSAILLAMVALACSNMLLRAVWEPVTGSFELMGFAGALLAGFGLGATQAEGGHIAVTLLNGRFSKRTEQGIRVIADLLGLAFILTVSWQVAEFGLSLKEFEELSETLNIAYYPVVFAVALGALAMGLTLLADLARTLTSQRNS